MIGNINGDWFDRKEKDENKKQDENDEYNEFLDKFEAKKTTDDCYTPDQVYEAVAGWVAKEYDVNPKNFFRPFYPGGDYKKEKYKDNYIVVDNPPFSILSEIIKFYSSKGIRYFLFAPTLTLFSSSSTTCCAIGCGVTVEYENKAMVNTSFLTNLENKRFRSAPELYQVIKKAVDDIRKEQTKELPKYSYPDEVVTSTMLSYLSHYGIDFSAEKNETERIRELDSQKEKGKAIFGSGFLISETKAAEKAAAEKAAAEKWELSEREKKIVMKLGRQCEA